MRASCPKFVGMVTGSEVKGSCPGSPQQFGVAPKANPTPEGR